MPAKKAAKKSASKPAAKKPAAKKAAPKAASGKAAAKIPPRADKGVGEAAVQARLKALAEPSRSIVARIHALVTKNAPSLEPAVKWGFAVYSRDGKMLLVATPRKNHVTFGWTMDADKLGVGKGWVEYKTVDEIDEAKVAQWAKRAASG